MFIQLAENVVDFVETVQQQLISVEEEGDVVEEEGDVVGVAEGVVGVKDEEESVRKVSSTNLQFYFFRQPVILHVFYCLQKSENVSYVERGATWQCK